MSKSLSKSRSKSRSLSKALKKVGKYLKEVLKSKGSNSNTTKVGSLANNGNISVAGNVGRIVNIFPGK